MRGAAALLAACSCLLLAPPALAQTAGSSGAAVGTPGFTLPRDGNELTSPPSLDSPPPGFVRTGFEVLDTARRVPRIRAMLARHPGHTRAVYLKGPGRWQVSFFERERPRTARKEIGQVLIDDRSGVALEAWTGFQVAWTMARGYEGAFARKVNALYVWIPLCLLFVLPFIDPRRPLRLLHLDLLVLVGLFSAGLAFFNQGNIGVSVPLAYPPLAYLLARMLWVGLRARAPDPVRLLVPASWLVVGLVFLLGFRIGLNVLNSNVIDVGYAGVIGADRIADGERLYGAFPTDNEHGDTYGPINYAAYLPAEQALPWSGSWDDLPAAHAAAIVFDLLCVALLFLLGRRLRGPTLGLALAYAWAAYPFTLFALNSNSNDSLIAALLVAALLAASSAPARGVAAALAGFAKLAPLVLVPLLAFHREPVERAGRSGAREVLRFFVGFAAVALPCLAYLLAREDLSTVYDSTLAYQLERDSPFSLWGFVGGLGAIQGAIQAGTIALALLFAAYPRRRDTVTLAALAAAVLLAFQLGVTHWFYLYIPWFFPLVMVALLGRGLVERGAGAAATPRLEPAPAPARSRPPASVATP